jgi:putative nucleotidyltransferase with HDIG domain
VKVNGNPLLNLDLGVLVQDPHALVRDCLRLVIEDIEGARIVGEAIAPEDVPVLARQTRPDVVIVNLEERAIPIIEMLASELPNTKIICLADEPQGTIVEAAMQAGANGLTLKSDSLEDLARAFDGVRNGRQVIAPEAAEVVLQHALGIVQEKRHRDAAIIETLASAVEAKDRYTGKHAHRVAALATKIAGQVDPFLGHNEQLRYGFILHDVGKIGVPESILHKEGSLDASEWDVMKTHPLIGLNIISPLGFGSDVEGVVRSHHERWDGGGYPDGLSDQEIPLGARIFSVADAFDAMTTDRPYREGMAPDQAIEEIKIGSGSQFDPAVVEAFVSLTV